MRRGSLRRAVRVVSGCWLGLLAASSAHGASVVDGDRLDARVEEMLERWQGVYTSEFPGQYALHPEKPTATVWAIVARVEVPALGHYVLFNEIRADGPDGPIVRQRLIAFDDDPARHFNAVTFHSVTDAQRFAHAERHPQLLRALTPADVHSYGPGCRLHVIGTGDGGQVLTAPRDRCVFANAATGHAAYMEVQVILRPEGWTFSEAGYDVDGRFIGGNREPARFVRVRNPDRVPPRS